jgi:membrane protease YdiL (CAAX protease family)
MDAVEDPSADPRKQTGEESRGKWSGNRRLKAEILLVLGVSLGQSGIYAAISLAAKLTAGPPLAEQKATLNASQSVRPYLDLTYQLVGIAFTLVPVALALWMLSATIPHLLYRLGLTWRRPPHDPEPEDDETLREAIARTLRRALPDLLHGAGLAALIGIPGLALYFGGRELGITATIIPAALDPHWWTIPVLILQAVKNAVLEEIIVVGYLVTRLRDLRWSTPAILAASAVLRGSYHLYQGFGPFIGNAVMGLIFAEWYRRGGRLMPLIVAHTILDIVSFVGYDLFGGVLGLK